METKLPDVLPVELLRDGTPQASVRSRSFFDAGERKFVEASEVHRTALGAGQAIDGPALIVEDETTTIVTSAFRAVGQFDGSLRLMKKEGAR